MGASFTRGYVGPSVSDPDRKSVIVSGQIDGGAPPSPANNVVHICTTAGGVYNLKQLYLRSDGAWVPIAHLENRVMLVTDALSGGTDEYLADHLYTWDADGAIWVDVGPAVGVVFGPVGATDHAVVRYDGVTGLLVENSTLILSDAGLLTFNGAGSYLTDIGIADGHLFIADTPDQLFIGPGSGNMGVSTASKMTAVGKNALAAATSGDAGTGANVAVGDDCLAGVTDGAYNVAIGVQAGDNLTTGDNCVFIGYDVAATAVGVSNEVNIRNDIFVAGDGEQIFFGRNVGNLGTSTATATVAIGLNALAVLTSGIGNIAVGSGALAATTIGYGNLGFGTGALAANTIGFMNSVFGQGALALNTDGDDNVAIGAESLSVSVSGNYNTVVGRYALRYGVGSLNTVVGGLAGNGASGTSVFENTCLFGYKAGFAITTGDNNIILGYQAADNLTTGSGNIFIGYDIDASAVGVDNELNIGNTLIVHDPTYLTLLGRGAGNWGTSTGAYNTAIGYQCLAALTSGTVNVAVGHQVLSKNTTGAKNMGLGSSALRENIGGSLNIAIGNEALLLNTTGGWNIAIGSNALDANVSNNFNIAIGTGVLTASNGGAANVGIGHTALDTLTTGDNNIAIGYQAGDNLTTGSTNIIIGYDIDASSASVSNELNIGGTIFGDLSSDLVRIGGAGAITQTEDLYLAGGNGLDMGTGEIVNGHIASALVDIPVISTPTVDKLDELISRLGSAGTTEADYLTDGGSQQFDIAGGAGLIRTTDSHTGDLKSFEWAAAPGNAIPDGTARYAGVEYNAGSPQAVVKTVDTWNDHTEFRLGSVVREGTTLHILNNAQGASNGISHIFHRFYETEPFRRADRLGGLILGETGARNLTVTAGELYDGFNEFVISAIDTSAADTLDAYYGSFTKVAAQTQWDNAQWDNAGVLTAFTSNRWGVHWLYLEADRNLVLIYGQAQFTSQANAEASTAPASVPLRLQIHGKIIGRLVFQEGDAAATEVQSAFSTTFSGTGVTNHNELGNLNAGDYVHLTAANNTDLTDAGDSALHYHATDRARANHTGTQLKATISDFAHGFAGALHSADTFANLNTKVSDGSLTKFAGQIGGTAAIPDIRGIRETGGPTLLTVGAIADGQFVKRSGATLIGGAPGGSENLDWIPSAEHPLNGGAGQTLYNSANMDGATFKVDREVTFNRVVLHSGVSLSGTFTARVTIYQDSDGGVSTSWAKVFDGTFTNTVGANTTFEVADGGAGDIVLTPGVYVLVIGRVSGTGSPWVESYFTTDTSLLTNSLASNTHPTIWSGVVSAASPPATVNPTVASASTLTKIIVHRFKKV